MRLIMRKYGITVRYRPKRFISGAIETKVRKERFYFNCVRSNLRLLSFDAPEYRPLQTYSNGKTLASLICELFVPAHFGVTRRKWSYAHNRVVPTNARAI